VAEKMIGEGKEEAAHDLEETAPPSAEAPAEEDVRPEIPREIEEPAAAPTPVTAEAPVMQEQEEAVPPKASMRAKDIRTSPLVRRLARQHQIDLSKIQGTGLSGRITKQDIQQFLDQAARTPEVPVPQPGQELGITEHSTASIPAEAAVLPKAGAEPAFVEPEALRFHGETETVAMSIIRKAIAEHMVRSKHTSAHVHTVFHVDVTAMVSLIKQHKEEFEAREGLKLTYTPFLVKALVDTIREFPVINSSISADSIVYKKTVNVGVAVALEDGLIVPVVKEANLKSFTGLALAIHDLAERARTKRLLPDDVQGGTVTITNPGIYGSVFATPIINQPQVAILGVGGIEKRPVVLNDAIAIRSMVYLALGFDHRVIDGAIADQFMASLKNRLQSWSEWTE